MNAKRILALFLAVLMLALPLVSCTPKDAGNDPDTNTDDGQTNDPTKNENSVSAAVKAEFAGNDYDGYTFRIMSPGRGGHYYFMLDGDTGFANEIWYEEDAAEAQQHSVFTRNTLTEELLNINIEPLWSNKLYWEMTEPIKTLIKSGGESFDMLIASHTISLPLASEGYFFNLTDIDALDLERDWWDQEYINTFAYKRNNLYTVCGDYNIFDDYATPVVFYNKQVLDDYNLEDPADCVDAGTWTIDKMMTLVDSVTNDTTGDGKLTEDDTWGLTDNNGFMYHFIQGCNVALTAVDEEGVPQIAIEKEEFTNAVQYIFNRIAQSSNATFVENGICYDMFEEDRALFYHEILAGINMLRDMESDFSLLPLPKLNEEQKNYTSFAQGIYLTVLSVPLSMELANADRTGTIMNVLAGFSTDTVDAALHEVVLGPKLFREKRTNDMLSYALKARKYDWADNMRWAYALMNLVNDQGSMSTFTLASSIQTKLKVLRNSLKKFCYGLETK